MMEEGFFRNKPADYVWLMVFSASVLLVISVKYLKKFDVVHAHVTQHYYHIIDHSTICFSAFYGICSLIYHGLHLG